MRFLHLCVCDHSTPLTFGDYDEIVEQCKDKPTFIHSMPFVYAHARLSFRFLFRVARTSFIQTSVHQRVQRYITFLCTNCQVRYTSPLCAAAPYDWHKHAYYTLWRTDICCALALVWGRQDTHTRTHARASEKEVHGMINKLWKKGGKRRDYSCVERNELRPISDSLHLMNAKCGLLQRVNRLQRTCNHCFIPSHGYVMTNWQRQKIYICIQVKTASR